MGVNVSLIPLDQIVVPSFLPMREYVTDEKLKELRESISKHGLMYPIKVRVGKSTGSYELKDGYLRWRCVKSLGWKEISAEINETSDENVVVESLITNKDRMEEDPFTIAKKLHILVNTFGWTQERVGQEIGMDQTRVSHLIQLLRLPEQIQHYAITHNVKVGHAECLLEISEPLQTQFVHDIVEHDLTVNELRQKIWDFKLMPHHAKTVTSTPAMPNNPTAQCSNPACLKLLHEDEIITIDEQPYCRACAPEAHVKHLREQHKTEPAPPSPKVLDTFEQRRAHMQTADPKIDTDMFQRLSKNSTVIDGGWKLEYHKRYVLLEVESDVTLTNEKLGVEIPVFWDGPVHSGRRLDRDDRNRDLLVKRHPHLSLLPLVYKTPTDKEEDRLEKAVVARLEQLCDEGKKWEN